MQRRIRISPPRIQEREPREGPPKPDLPEIGISLRKLQIIQRAIDYTLFFSDLLSLPDDQRYTPQVITKLREISTAALELRSDPDHRNQAIEWSQDAAKHTIKGLATKIRHGINLTEGDQTLIATVSECIALLPGSEALKLKAGVSALQASNLNLMDRNYIRKLQEEWTSLENSLADPNVPEIEKKTLRAGLDQICEELRILQH